MTRFLFEGLYVVVLGTMLGGLHALQIAIPPPPEVPEAQVIAEIVAVPPKPEGAQVGEGEGEGTLYTEEGCRARKDDYRNACFHSLALQRSERDPEGALDACAEILDDEEETYECISDVAELHSTVDRDWSEETCRNDIPVDNRTWHGQCWFGIALAHSTVDPEYARATCEEALDWKNFCRHDVNGEIAQIDPEAAFQWCIDTPMTDLQLKGCYHGLGKYLGRVDVPKALEICRRIDDSPAILEQQCFHGLGWALAESDPGMALATCRAEGGRTTDSCLLGVSANAVRFDPEQAVQICEEVGDARLKKACLKFATR